AGRARSRPTPAALFVDDRRVQARPPATVEALEERHVFFGELEAEDLEVLVDPRRRRGFRDDDVALLDVPAEDDLSRRLAVPGCHLRDDGMVEHLALGQRAVRLGHEVEVAAVLPQLSLLPSWVA